MAQKIPVKASTQDHLSIEDIRDDLTILKAGGAALVLRTTAVNFGLLSEEEQDATIYTYAALLNSLTFPIQIVIRSKKTDISSYAKLIDEAYQKQPNPDLKAQIAHYKQFVIATVQQNEVLDKQFYLVIPFSPLEAGFRGIKQTKGVLPAAQILELAKPALATRRDHVIKQLSRLGIKAFQLTTQQLIELYFDIYNPASVNLQKVGLEAGSYTTPIVQPAMEPAPLNQAPAPVPPASPSQGGPIAPATPQPETPQPAPVQPVQPVEPVAPQVPFRPFAQNETPQSPPVVQPVPEPIQSAPQPAQPSAPPAATAATPVQVSDALSKLREATAKAQEAISTNPQGGGTK